MMSFRMDIIFLVIAMLCVTYSQGFAKLLVSKNILNDFAVEGKDLTIKYTLFNTGESTATNVRLVEPGFPREVFESVSGSFNAEWKHLVAGDNVTHVIVVKPLRSLYYNVSSAIVSYETSNSLDEIEVKRVDSTAQGEIGIYSLKDYSKRFSSHIADWLVFGAMCLPSILVPYYLWSSSAAKYASQGKHKKA